MDNKEKRLKALQDLAQIDELGLDKISWPPEREVEGLRLVCTCIACPEQYNVFDGKKQVGYLRLRHGKFRADCPDCGGETVYSSNTKGDGTFNDDEREREIAAAISNIKEWYKSRKA